MSKFIKMILVCLFVLFGLTPTFAGEEEKRDYIIEIIKLTNVLEVFDGMKETAVQQLENNLKAQDTSFTAEQVEATKEVMYEYFDDLKPDLVALTIRIHNDNYTEDELRQLVDFYKSDLGQIFIEKVPQIANQTMVETNALIRGTQSELQRRIAEKLKELEAETTS